MCFFNDYSYKEILNMSNDIFKKAGGLKKASGVRDLDGLKGLTSGQNETLKALNNQFAANMKAWQDYSSEACVKINRTSFEK